MMFTKAQKARIMEWEAIRKEDGRTAGTMTVSYDTFNARQLEVFKEVGLVARFYDYGKGRQKELTIDVAKLVEVVESFHKPAGKRLPTFRATDEEWEAIKRFKACLEKNPSATMNALFKLEENIEE